MNARLAPAVAVTGALALTDAEFSGFQAFIHREAGIWLSPVKRALLAGRLTRRVRELRLGSFGEYLRLVRSDPAEQLHMLDCVSTNQTHFFREPRHFELLVRQVVPAWIAEAEAGRRPRRVRAWSAACSSGEEPYSLAMCLLGALPPGAGWTVEILATDLSTRMLERAERAIWPIERSREIPPALLEAFMLRGAGSQAGNMKAGPELRAIVHLARLNLNDAAYPSLGEFDLVFCRNVLIYFDAATKARVIERLRRHLAPAGLLFLGHAESLNRQDAGLQAVQPTVYAHARPSAERTR